MVTKDNDQTSLDSQNEASEDEGQTSQEQETYSKAELEEQVKKQVNDALAAAGRTAQAFEERERNIRGIREEAERRLKEASEREERRETEELNAVKDNPELYNAIQERQKARRDRMDAMRIKLEAEAKEQSIAKELAEARTLKRENLVKNIATKYGIDAQKLQSVIDDNMDESRIDRIASVLPKTGGGRRPPDTNRGGGGGTPQTAQQIKLDYIQGKISIEERVKRLKAIGYQEIF